MAKMMKSFPVDDEVVAAVWRKANPKPFENLTFNAALRDILGLPGSRSNELAPSTPETTVAGATRSRPGIEGMSDRISRGSAPTKAPKADLRLLIAAGLLRDGEPLYLIDYRGNRVNQYKAVVANGRLGFEGNLYSMSLLARDLLQKLGFQSEFVRGPAHWVNADGRSIKELWERYLETQENTESLDDNQGSIRARPRTVIPGD